jgi:hypothetical protein
VGATERTPNGEAEAEEGGRLEGVGRQSELDARHVPASSPRMRQAVNVLVIAGTVAFTSLLLVSAATWAITQPQWILVLLASHFPAMVGLPLAAMAALVIVIILEARFEHVEMRLFGGFLEFSGASGPILLWAFCFATMAAALALIW